MEPWWCCRLARRDGRWLAVSGLSPTTPQWCCGSDPAETVDQFETDEGDERPLMVCGRARRAVGPFSVAACRRGGAEGSSRRVGTAPRGCGCHSGCRGGAAGSPAESARAARQGRGAGKRRSGAAGCSRRVGPVQPVLGRDVDRAVVVLRGEPTETGVRNVLAVPHGGAEVALRAELQRRTVLSPVAGSVSRLWLCCRTNPQRRERRPDDRGLPQVAAVKLRGRTRRGRRLANMDRPKEMVPWWCCGMRPQSRRAGDGPFTACMTP